jgi:hypothetical protein
MPQQPPASARRPPSPTQKLPEYVLLQTLCNDLRLLDQVQHQITAEDFDDADLQAIYIMLLRLASKGELTVSPYIIDEVTSPGQKDLLSKMVMEPVLSNQAAISKALDECLAKMRLRQPKAELQRIRKQLKMVGDGTAEQQQLLQELDRLSKKQFLSSS